MIRFQSLKVQTSLSRNSPCTSCSPVRNFWPQWAIVPYAHGRIVYTYAFVDVDPSLPVCRMFSGSYAEHRPLDPSS